MATKRHTRGRPGRDAVGMSVQVLEGDIQLGTKTLKKEKLLGNIIRYRCIIRIGGYTATLTDKR
jgi:hypothetical protein